MKWLKYIKLKRELKKRMTVVNETMALQELVDIYSENVCKMNHWKVRVGYDGLSYEFCEISFAFQNGYIKALRDNGLEFQNGLVKKRDIALDMPGGARRFYKDEISDEVKKKAIECLREVLGHYEKYKVNINQIVADFGKEIKAKED